MFGVGRRSTFGLVRDGCLKKRVHHMNARLGAILVCGLAMPAMAQTIVNGNFDLEVPRTSFGNGWTGFSNDGAGGWRSSGGNPGGYFIINDNGNSATDPSISQILTDLVAGQQYEVSGDFASWIAGGSNGPSFGADINGIELFAGTRGTHRVWQNFSFTFTADADTATLRLRAETNGTDNDFAVDNIAIALVPAPGALGLLGAAGLIAGRRRR